jgi:dephospho-CoA kinase
MAETSQVIAVVGMPGSGKGTFCEVAKSRGFEIVSFGDIAREVTKREAQNTEGAFAVHNVVDRLRKEIGPDWIAREAAKAAKTESICFDDVRTPEELAYLKEKFPTLKLFGIIANKEDRYSRLLARARWDDRGTREELEKKDSGGGAWGIPKLLELSDTKLENNGTLDEFRENCEEALAGV